MLFHLYLNDDEKRMLLELTKRTKLTKSSMVRKLIADYYVKVDIESNNVKDKINYLYALNKTFVDNIHRIGNNINQIAHQLNTNAQAEVKQPIDLNHIENTFLELKNVLVEYRDIVKKNKLNSLLKKARYYKRKNG